ncbi:hypothetical protein [Blastococcus sp. VKM Ac-2987]|uniref:hypothetical protein n=1 Tax=Blastococcus sp. VKM Ac-2987 TaxID=3004141 RepID=UPI0022AB7635|nr:hypothetical protein [Blastococcus sp. VKM Ac-2987]MCZ2860620.1 hypothetical protein [Blastococcus sp. VKM Ac-2987]
MSTEDRSAQAPGGRTRRDTDPLQMTEAEKRMAEWEARHDVSARGHRGAPDVVQHYLAHERLSHAAAPRPAPGRARPVPVQPAVPEPEPEATPPRRLGLLRRLLGRR